MPEDLTGQWRHYRQSTLSVWPTLEYYHSKDCPQKHGLFFYVKDLIGSALDNYNICFPRCACSPWMSEVERRSEPVTGHEALALTLERNRYDESRGATGTY